MSKKITNINVILTLLIVFMHSECLSYLNAPNEFIKLLIHGLLVITNVAVPTFFAISAYLFFKNYDNSKYWSKLKSRINSLVIPYFLWSTIFLIFFFVISKMPLFNSFDGSYTPIENNFLFFIKSIALAEYDGVLWYVQVLFIFVIISPLIYWICKKDFYIDSRY